MRERKEERKLRMLMKEKNKGKTEKELRVKKIIKTGNREKRRRRIPNERNERKGGKKRVVRMLMKEERKDRIELKGKLENK